MPNSHLAKYWLVEGGDQSPTTFLTILYSLEVIKWGNNIGKGKTMTMKLIGQNMWEINKLWRTSNSYLRKWLDNHDGVTLCLMWDFLRCFYINRNGWRWSDGKEICPWGDTQKDYFFAFSPCLPLFLPCSYLFITFLEPSISFCPWSLQAYLFISNVNNIFDLFHFLNYRTTFQRVLIEQLK